MAFDSQISICEPWTSILMWKTLSQSSDLWHHTKRPKAVPLTVNGRLPVWIDRLFAWTFIFKLCIFSEPKMYSYPPKKVLGTVSLLFHLLPSILCGTVHQYGTTDMKAAKTLLSFLPMAVININTDKTILTVGQRNYISECWNSVIFPFKFNDNTERVLKH